ncbi:hypothetical protein NC651_040617 [Populus alba x Populus x berolinensis]|nr:hypothetical protein NC651_040610 [Populus alba x Populus x berolinensis]KAJ6856065.1 hypothetical protein NC651_040617 [Populus alba x Populus x berolinensis]
MATACSLQQYGRPPPFINLHHKQKHSLSNCSSRIGVMVGNRSVMLQGFGNNNSNVEEHKAVAIYLNRLIPCGLGDPETSLTEVHPVCPQGGLSPQNYTITINYSVI